MINNRYTIYIARYPYGMVDLPPLTDWLMQLQGTLHADQRINGIISRWYDGTPITMMRNLTVREALEKNADILLMLDNDNIPDLHFWENTFNFMDERIRKDEAPAIVASPYCGPPPDENVYVFYWESKSSGDPEGTTSYRLVQIDRETASIKQGIEPVAAIPTGCVAIDMRLFTGYQGIRPLPKPWFYYEWQDEYQSEKKSTEDVTFSRNVSALYLAGCGQDTVFVNWDAWAFHRKTKNVYRPAKTVPYNIMQMFERYVKENE